MRIDSHQHFWRYDPVDYDWIGDGMDVLKRDFLPGDLQPQLDSVAIEGSVAVQARQTLEETRWLLDLADQSSIVKGVVGWVDLCSPDVGSQLEEFADHHAFCGVRHIVQGEPDDAFMLRDDFMRGISLLAEKELAYDILIFPRHLPVAIQLVEKFPDLRFVVDHIAKPPISEGKMEHWAKGIRDLAAFPNVMCKMSGMVTEAEWTTWKPGHFVPYLDVVFESFGTERIMFGSDWPVCLLAGSYVQVYQLVADYTDALSQIEQAALFGENATRFYNLAG